MPMLLGWTIALSRVQRHDLCWGKGNSYSLPLMHTHYDNLQVSRTASSEVIRASYRALIQKYHPDRFPDKERGARITQIVNAAYAILGDPERRSAYNAFLDATAKPDVSPAPSDAAPERRSGVPQTPPRPKPSASMWRRDLFVGGAIAVFVIGAIAQGVRTPSTRVQRGTVSTPRLESTPAVLTPEQSAAASVGVLAPAHPPAGSSTGTIAYTNKIPTELKKGSKVRIVSTYAAAGSQGKERHALYRIEEPPDGKEPGETLIEEPFKTGIYKVYSKSRRIAPLKIDLPHTDLAYFLKLMNPTTGKAVMTMMARGGDVLQVDVPLGTYRLRYAYGPVWFGEENKFGEDTRATEADADLTFAVVGDYASGHEVELVQQLNGNLKERPLDPALF